MANPFNPLDWLHAAQDWFTRTERSSGFRPYLIFLILVFGLALSLLLLFKESPYVLVTSISLVSVSVLSFIVLFAIKSFTDPNFCRSESHIEHLKKFELEHMGNESQQIAGYDLEKQLLVASIPDKNLLPPTATEKGAVQ